MENEKPPIPFRMTLLIEGYFQRTINEAEQAELDDWICASMDNQRAFDACVEVTMKPHHKNELDIEAEEIKRQEQLSEPDLPRIAELLVKYMNKTIAPDQQEELSEWVELSGVNEVLVNDMPQTDDMEQIARCFLSRLWHDKDQAEWN
jgi:hypothetical protein